jgi:hypothetical protein
VLPAHQGLDPGDGVACQVQDRLVVKLELATFEPDAQLRLDALTRLHRLAQLLGVGPRVPPAVALGIEQGQPGGYQQVTG